MAKACDNADDLWLPTASGKTFRLLGPDPADVDFQDVATGLANANRFSGQLEEPYSVAQHSALGADAVYDEALARGLAQHRARDLAAGFTLHDGHEFVTGDKTPMLIQALALISGADVAAAMDAIKARIDTAIYTRAGRRELLDDDEVAAIVKDMDSAMCRRERDDLIRHVDRDWRPEIAEARLLHLPRIRPVGWREARDMWIDRLKRYVL